MCRILLYTGNTLDRRLVADTLHQILTLATQDNVNGAGVSVPLANSEGVRLYKKGDPYWKGSILRWIDEYIDHGAGHVLAHVRAASSGTELSDRTAHPFGFELHDGTALVGVHNGYFTGMISRATPDEPKSDTYVALRQLVDHLNTHHLDKDVLEWSDIEVWAKDVLTYSAFALVFYFHGHYYIIRNTQRTLFATPFGNGMLIHTSKEILTIALRWTHIRFGEPSTPDPVIVDLPDGVFYRFGVGAGTNAGVQVVRGQIMEDSVSSYNTGGFRGNHYSSEVWDSTRSSATTNKETTQRLTTPAASSTTSKEVDAEVIKDVEARLNRIEAMKIWNRIRTLANPMREVMVERWVAHYFNVSLTADTIWSWIGIEKLELFELFLKKRGADPEESFESTTNALSSFERKVINGWNSAVYSAMDTVKYDEILAQLEAQYKVYWLEVSMDRVFAKLSTDPTFDKFLNRMNFEAKSEQQIEVYTS